MILLNGSKIKKMFLDETLFDSVSFNVDSNDKIGFIGVNGAGKSNQTAPIPLIKTVRIIL